MIEPTHLPKSSVEITLDGMAAVRSARKAIHQQMVLVPIVAAGSGARDPYPVPVTTPPPDLGLPLIDAAPNTCGVGVGRDPVDVPRVMSVAARLRRRSGQGDAVSPIPPSVRPPIGPCWRREPTPNRRLLTRSEQGGLGSDGVGFGCD